MVRPVIIDGDTENFAKSAFMRAQHVIDSDDFNIEKFVFFLRDEEKEMKRQYEYYLQQSICYHENVAKNRWFEYLAYGHMLQRLSDYLNNKNIIIQGF